jgi:hypothetical protein
VNADEWDDDDDDPPHFSQPGVIAAVLIYMGNCGIQEMPNTRQMNVLISGINDFLDELNRPDVPAAPGMGLSAWCHSDDWGMSSGHMAFVLAPHAGMQAINRSHWHECSHPMDPADFGRCYRLLRAVPELRPHLPKMAGASKEWAALVGAWDELEGLYEKELPTGECPKLYARMQELLGGKP